jgi:hypothetical protein
VQTKRLLRVTKHCYGCGASVAIAVSKDPYYVSGWANISDAGRAGWVAAIRKALRIGACNPELYR